MQQVDYSGATTRTITYTSDILGLSQVLASDDGATQTSILFGLDLIYQDDGSETRTLLADGLGSARAELVDGAVKTVTTNGPFGAMLAQVGSSGTVYGFTGEETDGATSLIFLRARYYNPQLKVFLSRDPSPGDPNYPQTLNGWSYVENNPVNRIDPTGWQSECAGRTCGPDVTDWLMQEMADHYHYGQGIRNQRTPMELRGMIQPPFIPLPLYALATDDPFRTIVDQWRFRIPGTQLQVPLGFFPVYAGEAKVIIGGLGIFEYAHYGLAVDYVRIGDDYRLPGGQCGDCTVGKDDHKTVTLCDNCIDSSDIGNMMFGLGGQARGYSTPFSFGAATRYNWLADGASFFGAFLTRDGRGAIPGWLIGFSSAFNSKSLFCNIINGTRVIGYNDNLEEVQRCAACTTEVSSPATEPPSSIFRVSNANLFGSTSTIDELKFRLGLR